MNTLLCPACGEQCTTMPSNPEGMWFEGDEGVCQCGAKLHVVVDDVLGLASLEIDEEEK